MKRVLIVEDDPFFQKFYSMKLKEAGFEVFVAKDGDDGLKMMRLVSPTVVLLDLIMPIKTGFDVLRARMLDESLKAIPVLVFSTLTQQEEIDEAMKLGAQGYINKSIIDFQQALAKMSSVIPQ